MHNRKRKYKSGAHTGHGGLTGCCSGPTVSRGRAGPNSAALRPAALHDGHNIWQEAVSVVPGDIEHLHVTPFPDFFHQGQWLPFGDWDSANHDNAWCGQHLADRLDERLAEELHLPDLVNDTHSVFGATAGACVS